ncbi:MAG: tRNA (guanine(37)-N(1))-methyltransferase [Actinobacteria bacterium]|nr:tRNA (guanine(37)-N(1))-methyltransferase [Actinomycetota bacterium]
MKISILTLFPKMISGFFNESIIKRAIDKKLVEIDIIDLRQFAKDDYGTVDDRPYGGGAGMVMRIDVIHKALMKISNDKFQMTNQVQNSKSKNKIVLTSPKGKLFTQKMAVNYSKLDKLIIIAGHYEGIDERVMNFVDEAVSIGDFVLTGGEIAASAIVDSVTRLLPMVLKKDEATKIETFFEITTSRLSEVIGKNKKLDNLIKKGVRKIKLLEYPQYTRPETFHNVRVPEILLSGNHKNIDEWRLKEAFDLTLKYRPDFLL